jgi:hypothetical protein
MYRVNVLLIFAAVYFGLNAISGYFYCEENFCPGDREDDYVYTVKDSDGKTWYMENGKAVSEEEYRVEHKNWFDYREKKDDNGK